MKVLVAILLLLISMSYIMSYKTRLRRNNSTLMKCIQKSASDRLKCERKCGNDLEQGSNLNSLTCSTDCTNQGQKQVMNCFNNVFDNN